MHTIALAGKGSSGKTSLAPSLIRALTTARPHARRLVGDLDPHQSLTTLLGHDGVKTLGQLRSRYERTLLSGEALRPDETREHFIEARLGEEALLPTPGYDFLALGQWELAGSQCVPNRVMDRALAQMLTRYDVALFDHEAGIEHLGRYVSLPLSALVIISTPERMALDVARRIWGQTLHLGRPVSAAYLLLNRVRPSDLMRPHVLATLDDLQVAGVTFLGAVPEAPDEPAMLPADHPWQAVAESRWGPLITALFRPASLAASLDHLRQLRADHVPSSCDPAETRVSAD